MKSKGLKIAVLVLTCLPIGYLAVIVLFLASMVKAMLSESPGLPDRSSLAFLSLVLAFHFVTLVWVLLITVFYLAYVAKTDRMTTGGKALWVGIFLTLNVFAMPVFWYWYIWREPAEGEPEAEGDNSQ